MDLFVYAWHLLDNIIYTFSLNYKNETVLLKIPFQPYCYVLLPENIAWNNSAVQLFGNYLTKNFLQKERPISMTLCQKYRLYGARLDEFGNRKKYFFLKCFFLRRNHMFEFSNKINNSEHVICGIGSLKLSTFEDKCSPILQFYTNCGVDTVGWINVGKFKILQEKESFCDLEIVCTDICSLKKSIHVEHMPQLKICSFDIECAPEDKTKFPNALMPNDVCFQISCVLFHLENTNNLKTEKYLLSVGKVDKIFYNDDESVNVLEFKNECELLKGFATFLREKKIHICIGYNIFQFDIPYLIERSRQNQCFDFFSKQSFLKNISCKEKKIKWSSCAYQVQEYIFLENHGRIFIDLLPVVQKEYKLENYKLNTVSEYFLKQKKDDLDYEDINRFFEEFSPQSLALIGKYCVQDSMLVANLFIKLQIFYNLFSMANVCRVTLDTLLLYGQQIKVYSLIYQYCVDNNFVVEKPNCREFSEERYTGAYVFEPKPGIYKNVVPFDFASLYPTTIIAYNIDYSTFVLNEDNQIDDKDCNIMQWEEHINCIHDVSTSHHTSKTVICKKYVFKFIKNIKGILPSIIEKLLNERKETRKMLAHEKDEFKKMILNQRQLAFKISANSMYGITGVKSGMLPFMPLAMSITFKGRENVIRAAQLIQENFGGQIVYGDTDSNYIYFPHMNVEHLYEHGNFVSREISKQFPDPIQLEFENEIYSKFLIFTKKRYCYVKMEKNGEISNTIGKKGILLCRRDTCKFVQEVFENVVKRIFHFDYDLFSTNLRRKQAFNIVEAYLIDCIQRLLTRQIPTDQLTITKSFNDFRSEKIINGKLGHYKVKCNENIENTTDEYYVKQLPALCQLVDRIEKRGDFKFEGRRLQYVMLDTGRKTDKQGDKIEQVDYFLKNNQKLSIDYFYYFERLSVPIDEILEIVFKQKNWMKKNFQYHFKNKKNFLDQIKKFKKPILIFETC